MTIKEKIKVMQAFADGKEVEIRHKTTQEFSETKNPTWDWLMNDYRIKEEPKYVPYTYNDAKELIGKVVVKKESKVMAMIVGVNREYVNVAGYGNVPFIDMLNNFTDLNSNPLGKIVL